MLHNCDDIEIIDAHIHLPSSHSLFPSFYEPIGDNIYSAIRKYFPRMSKEAAINNIKSVYSDHNAEKLILDMNEANIKKAILLLPDLTYALKGVHYSIEDQIEQHINVIKTNPGRFYLMAGVDPRWGKSGFELFKKYVDQKVINGLKLYTPCGYFPNDPKLRPYYELCSDIKMPVIFHTGPTSPVFRFEYSRIQHIDEIAHKYPNINIILAHGGVNNIDEAVELCAYRPNVYLDISGYMMTKDPLGPLKALKNLFKRKVNHKIIFGTDWPIGGYKSKYHGIVKSLLKPENDVITQLSKSEVRMIFNENILELLYQ
ncbi:UNVERIFIED_CONTAM: hypothetical protein Cloal_0301 [Acetivibrio alkalicellulosi]